MDFNRFFTNQELETELKKLLEQHPNLMKLDTLGKSFENRPIWIATVTNQETGVDTDKPAVWIDANIHATELAGATTSMRILFTLLTEYGKNPKITALLDSSVYYIVPRVNPDGAELAMADIPQFVRSGVRPFPWDEKSEGLHMADVDEDGRILQMRVEDPNGNWKISELDPRLMEKRDADEQGGKYYRLFFEGYLEDYDGYQIKIAPSHAGLDFNRNFPIDWRTNDEQLGAGPFPTSEPEIRAMVDFITSHKNINAGITYHTYSGVILRPPSTHPDDEMDTNDLTTYKAICKRAKELTGYPTASVYHDFRYHPKQVISGVFDDWMYGHLGIYAFTVEQWDIVGRSGIKDRKFMDWFRDHPHEDDLKILKWADENIGESAYIDWYEFDHPQLGKIELGGWDNLYSWRNPPQHFMGEESERNVPFALSLGYMLPHLEINTLEVKKVKEDTFTLNLVVDNTGFFPSFTSNLGKKRASSRPVRVEIELPEGAEMLVGRERDELGHLEGRSNKMDQIFGVTSPTDNRARKEWTIKASSGSKLKINIKSERAGSIYQEVELK